MLEIDPVEPLTSLLFDQNISHRIVRHIEPVLPHTKQVREIGLEGASDKSIWEYAKDNDFAIVTFDADFYDFSQFYGCPPKVIWLRFGNTTTRKLADILIQNQQVIQDFLLDAEVECLQIFSTP